MYTKTTGLSYSNPRMSCVIEDWPLGSTKRTKATFTIEQNARGERAVRVTVDPKTGRDCTPKKLTYALRMRFVDGSDGRLYIIEDNSNYGHLSVMRGTFDQQHEVIYKDSERHAEVLALFNVEAVS